jgi:hypothetical protein
VISSSLNKEAPAYVIVMLLTLILFGQWIDYRFTIGRFGLRSLMYQALLPVVERQAIPPFVRDAYVETQESRSAKLWSTLRATSTIAFLTLIFSVAVSSLFDEEVISLTETLLCLALATTLTSITASFRLLLSSTLDQQLGHGGWSDLLFHPQFATLWTERSLNRIILLVALSLPIGPPSLNFGRRVVALSLAISFVLVDFLSARSLQIAWYSFRI